MSRLLLVLVGSSLLAKQQLLSSVHAFSSSIAPTTAVAARPSLVGTTAAATRRHRSLLSTVVTMISNNNNDNNNDNAVEENELFTSYSRRDILRRAAATTATAAAITTTTAWTRMYPPLPAIAATPVAGVVVVAGATGQTGRRILERLSKQAATTAVVGGVRDIPKAQKSLSESSTIIRGAMIQQVNSINIGGDGEGGGSSRLVLKHLDVVKDTVEELKDTLSGASALVIATGFVPGNPLKMNVAAHEVDNVGTCKLIVSAQTKYYIYTHIEVSNHCAGFIMCWRFAFSLSLF
jgi:hypothetical protein